MLHGSLTDGSKVTTVFRGDSTGHTAIVTLPPPVRDPVQERLQQNRFGPVLVGGWYQFGEEQDQAEGRPQGQADRAAEAQAGQGGAQSRPQAMNPKRLMGIAR